jgi:hypothetical protein
MARIYVHSTLYLVVILSIACQRARRTARGRRDVQMAPLVSWYRDPNAVSQAPGLSETAAG